MVEYKINSGAWKRLDGSASIKVQCNLAQDTLRVRRTAWEGGAVMLSAEVELAGATAALVTQGGANGIANGIMSYMPAGGSTVTATPAGGTAYNNTYCNVLSCPVPFQAIRIGFENESTTDPLTIKCKVASQATATGVSGTLLSWLAVTFGGVDSITIPVAQTMNGEVVRSFVWSDLIPLRALARTDVVGADSLINIRTYSAGTIMNRSMAMTNEAWIDSGDFMAGTYATGDKVSVIDGTMGMTPTTTGTKYLPFAQIDFYTGGKTASISAYGDSMTGGTSTHPWPWPLAMRKAFRTLGLPGVNIANCATAGQKRDVTSRLLQERCLKTKPKAVVLWNYSVNGISGLTGVTPQQQMYILISDLEFCRANGIMPIVVSMHPDATDNASTRQFLSGWGVFLDLAQLLRTSASDPAILYPTYSGDRTHLTNAAVNEFATYGASKIAGVL